MEENITGGVSPLKKGKWRGRRGKRGGTVGDTRYKRDKWVKPKSGGTTVKAPKAPNPKKPYTIAPDGKVQMTPPGDVNITEGDNIINNTSGGGYNETTTKEPDTDAIYKTTKGRLPTFQEAWDANKEDINNKYNTFEDYKTDMLGIKKGDKRDKEREEARAKAEKESTELVQGATEGKTTTTKEYVPDEGAVLTINDEGHSVTRMLGAVGKYKLGGYRAMKKNRK